MIPRTRIRHLVGLSKELSLLEDRIADLCEHRHGGTILISGPKGRGKTLLWQTALEAAKRGSSLPCVVSIDLENAPRTYGELLATVQQPGFLPANGTTAATTLVKAFCDAAVQFPIPWLSKFIVKFIGALPEIAERLTKSHLEEEKGRGDLGFGLFKEVVGMAGRSAPLLLIIENVEAASTMSTDRAIDQIVELIRQNLPILLVITSNEGRLSRESAFLLNERVEVGDAKLCQLPAVSKDDIRDAFSSASKPVLDELYQLAGGDISTFQDLWHECEQLKLIQKGRRGWIWNTEEETDQLGKLTDGAYAALNRITQQCAAKVGDEKLARLALGAAALQGQIFCDEVVANVLWRMGLRLADQYTSDDGHLQKFISLFNNQICDVATNGRLDEGRHFHEFRSILLRHYAKSDIPSEYRKLLREFTAAALEQHFAKKLSEYAWLIITLYEECGQLDRARNLHEQFTRPPSPVAQKWELQRLSDKMRAIHSEAGWAAWAISICNHLSDVNAVKDEVGRLLDEVIVTMTLVGDTQLRHEAVLAKADHLHSQGLYLQAYNLAGDLLSSLNEKQSPSAAGRCSDLQAKALMALGRYQEAEPLIRHRLDSAERTFGPDNIAVAAHLDSLAMLLEKREQLAEAEALMRRALKMAQKNFEQDGPDIAKYFNNLASVLIAMYRFAEAEPILRRCLDIAEKKFGPDHPNVALALNNLGLVLVNLNQFAEAEVLLRRALDISEQDLRSDHPNTAMLVNNLALVLMDTNRPGEAEPLLRRSLEINERSLGPDHPTVALNLGNLAHSLIETGRINEAELLLQRALAIAKNSLEPQHSHVGMIYSQFARVLKHMNRMDEAELSLRRGLIILLRPTALSGYPHPKLRGGFDRYRKILLEMSLSEEEIDRRFKELGKEAGFDAESYDRLLRSMGTQ